jgi:hypothetical protein
MPEQQQQQQQEQTSLAMSCWASNIRAGPVDTLCKLIKTRSGLLAGCEMGSLLLLNNKASITLSTSNVLLAVVGWCALSVFPPRVTDGK